MTLDTLLAVIGLAVAAYQLMPRARQLDLAVRFHRFDWLLLTATASTIIYLQFFTFFQAVGWTPKGDLSRWGMTPELVSFGLLTLCVAVVAAHIRLAKLPRSRIRRLIELVEQLMWDGNAAEATRVVERHIARLRQLACGASYWTRVRRYAAPTQEDRRSEISEAIEAIQSDDDFVPQGIRTRDRIRRTIAPIVRYLPPPTTRCQDAAWLLSRVQRSNDFALAAARHNPYLALQFMKTPDHDTFAFMKLYFRALLADASSVLYREVRDHSGSGYGRPFSADASERLLAFLFNEPHEAERLHVWTPVGDAVLDELRTLRRNAASDPYNLPADDTFRNEEQWQASLFTGICFFDLMVSAALHAGVHSNMWLMYYADFAEDMIENHSPQRPHEYGDSFYETRYTYLIYQMVDRCRHWLLGIGRIAATDNPHREVTPDDAYDTIPKAATHCLRRILFSVLTASHLTPVFRHRIAHLVFDTYFRLRRGISDDLALVLANAIASGDHYNRGRDARYRSELRLSFDSYDTIPHIMTGVRRGHNADPLADFTAIVFGAE